MSVNSSTSAAYAAGYIFKKIHGDLAKTHYQRIDADGVCHSVEPEFARMSLRPGIGRGWYERYASDFHTHDYAVHDGRRFPVPKYYDRLLEEATRIDSQSCARIESYARCPIEPTTGRKGSR